MARVRIKKNIKIKSSDINKNTGKDISHTIMKIKANERKYTIILMFIFIIIFTIVGFFTLRISTKDFNEKDIKYEDPRVLFDYSKIMDNKDGLSNTIYSLSIDNNKKEKVNYEIIFIEDTESVNNCGCSTRKIDSKYLNFSKDGETTLKFENAKEMLIDSGFVDALSKKDINISGWIDKNNDTGLLKNYHFHGKFMFIEKEN